MMPRVTRSRPVWNEMYRNQEDVRLGRPKATRKGISSQQAQAPAQVLRMAGQLRGGDAALRAGTAFDASSRAWVPLRMGSYGAYHLGQDEGPAEPPREEMPPPPGGTQAGPAPGPSVDFARPEAEAVLEALDSSIAKVAEASDLERKEACGLAIDPLVLADARSFRARLADELARPETDLVQATVRDIHATDLVTACADGLSSKRRKSFALIGIAALAVGVIVVGIAF